MRGAGNGISKNNNHNIIFAFGRIHDFGIELRLTHNVAGKIDGIINGAVRRQNCPQLFPEGGRWRGSLQTQFFRLVNG